jgi:hypothetical protein
LSPRGSDTVPATTLVVDAFPGAGISGALGEELQGPPSGLSHLLGGIRFALARPRVLLFLCLWSWLLPLAVALPYYASAQRHLSQAQASADEGPADLLGATPAWMFSEWAYAGAGELAVVSQVAAPLFLLSSLFGLLVASGWMGSIVHSRDRHGLRAFLGAGGRHFFAFGRTWVLGLPLFALWTWLVFGAPGQAIVTRFVEDGDLSLAPSEVVARRIANTREVLYVLGLLGLELWLDLARATLAVGKRSSSLVALARGAREGLRRPLGVLTLVGVGIGLEVLWLAGLKAGSEALAIGPLALGLLLPFGRVVLRGARLAGLASFIAQSESARREARAQRPGPPLPEDYAAL